MKTKFETLQQMKRDLRAVINHIGYIRIYNAYKENPARVAFDLWNIVFVNRKYTTDNPNVIFVGSGRLLSYMPNYELYPDNTNDNTLQTALLKVCNELLK